MIGPPVFNYHNYHQNSFVSDHRKAFPIQHHVSRTSQRQFHFLYAWWKALFFYSRLVFFTSFCSDHHALYSFKVSLNNIFNFRVFHWNSSHFRSCAAPSSAFNYYRIKFVAPFFFITTFSIRITTYELLLPGMILNFCHRLPS